jgi:hypothetical protein
VEVSATLHKSKRNQLPIPQGMNGPTAIAV